ncbi:CPBP family intramembrane glutamic endopeptidase [Nocardioides sp. URHA0020]|uniref:CPBP family intramembrane glutamic endopeptidase n=1 Tax=Nocardioides sp. URHA0020 TaxID=1380392 RepID=UPI000686D82A|nr:CPBP family intramembrane glutamic endopeptidase [Nocardioides sp. URHA0020]
MSAVRQAVTIGFLVAGTVLLGVSFRIEPGSVWFYPSALALAAVWAVGALASGPVPLGDRRVLPPLAVGVLLAGVFVLGALIVRELSVLDDQVAAVTAYAVRGSGPLVAAVTLVTGAGEELFFRGAVYDRFPRRPVVATTAVYAVVTLATGNLALVLAAILLGLVVALVRRWSGGVLAPIVVHVTWSLVMLLALPQLF